MESATLARASPDSEQAARRTALMRGSSI